MLDISEIPRTSVASNQLNTTPSKARSTAESAAVENLRPRVRAIPATTDTTIRSLAASSPAIDVDMPVVLPYSPTEQSSHTVPIQIWEGRVLEVDNRTGTMQVALSAKLGSVEDHTAEINLEWIVEQDKDLVRPGAVFYWTLFKETKRGAISNSQELKFRRLPNWSKSQIDRIRENGRALWKRLRTITSK